MSMRFSLFAFALIVAGCGSSSAAGVPLAEHSMGPSEPATPKNPQALSRAKEDVRNSFQMEVLFLPTPVPVADTMKLVYELHLTNFSQETLKLTSVQIIDATSRIVIAHYRGRELGALLGRLDPDQATSEGRSISPGQRAIVYLNLPVHAVDTPQALRHRVEFNVMTGKGPEQAAVEGGVVEVKNTALPELDPPLRGGPWVAVYKSSWKRGHRRVFYATSGRARIPGRFAIDWMKVGEQHNPPVYVADGQAAGSNGLGADVLAVANASVLAMRDSMPAPENCAAHKPVTIEEDAGNYVILSLGNGHYAFYEHLQPGILVRPGEQVRSGQVIAALGCTGATTRPHLHFHVGNSPSLFSEGVPYLLKGARIIGLYSTMKEFLAGNKWHEYSPERNALQDAFFPASLMVVRFTESRVPGD